MAGVVTTTITFSNGDQVTSGKLNEITSGTSFTSDAITGTTLAVSGGKLKLGVVTSAEMGASSVTATAIAIGAVTNTKILAGAVTNDKLGIASVTQVNIAPGAVLFAGINSTLVPTITQVVNLNTETFLTPARAQFHPAVSKGFGVFNITNTTRAIKANAFNIASISRIDATHTQVVLTRNMNSINYTVLTSISYISGTPTAGEGSGVYDKQTTGFKIVHPTEATGKAVDFTVFGEYITT